jgi:hypothetical protein
MINIKERGHLRAGQRFRAKIPQKARAFCPKIPQKARAFCPKIPQKARALNYFSPKKRGLFPPKSAGVV